MNIYPYHCQIQKIANIEKVGQSMHFDLNRLFNNVINDVQNENAFTSHQNVVFNIVVFKQFHSGELL